MLAPTQLTKNSHSEDAPRFAHIDDANLFHHRRKDKHAEDPLQSFLIVHQHSRLRLQAEHSVVHTDTIAPSTQHALERSYPSRSSPPMLSKLALPSNLPAPSDKALRANQTTHLKKSSPMIAAMEPVAH